MPVFILQVRVVRSINITWLCLLPFLGVFAQKDSLNSSPYRLSWPLETSLVVPALSMGISYLVLDSKTAVLKEDVLQSFDPSQVNAFDRGATFNWSMPVATASDVCMYTSFAMPFSLLIDKKMRQDYLKISLMCAQTFALTASLTALTKNLVLRPRPFTYNQQVPLHYKQERSARYAFFSGHTSMTAAMCFFTATVVSDYYPRHKALPWIWTTAAVLPAVTGILRQQAGKHYWSDVICGYAVGALIGVLVPKIHRWTNKKKAKQPLPSF